MLAQLPSHTRAQRGRIGVAWVAVADQVDQASDEPCEGTPAVVPRPGLGGVVRDSRCRGSELRDQTFVARILLYPCEREMDGVTTACQDPHRRPEEPKVTGVQHEPDDPERPAIALHPEEPSGGRRTGGYDESRGGVDTSIPAPIHVTERETQKPEELRILAVLKSTATIRMLWPVLQGLAERGHRVDVATKEVKSSDTHDFAVGLVRETERLGFTPVPYMRSDGWGEVARAVRTGLDYLRYLGPEYESAPKLRARAEREVPPALRSVLRRSSRSGNLGVGLARSVLSFAEAGLEPPARATAFLREQRPDVLLLAPLVGFGSPQADLLRAARRLGIRTVYPVPSWDNLTNKGLLREPPDLVLVWNALQAEEAVTFHGVPPESVRQTGAPAYDPWFGRGPGRPREDFCRDVGLDPQQPYLLYAASSAFIAPGEATFFRRWLGSVRSAGGALGSAGVLVRPHPLAAREWETVGDEHGLRVWPRVGEFPLDDRTRDDYFDSIFHSAAVVGINTSAMVESAILDRPVLTILAEEFRDTQGGTIHFRYLVDPAFGHVVVAAGMDEHVQDLERAVESGDGGRGDRFVRRFLRPAGREQGATPLAVAAIEDLGTNPAPSPAGAPARAHLVRLGLTPAAAFAARRRRARKQRRPQGPALDEARRAVRDLARAGSGPVLAGPWQGEALHELLCWIPFLRWAATANLELADRLAVVVADGHEDWYAGLPGRIVTDDETAARALDPALIEPHVPALLEQDPAAPLHERMVAFAPIPRPPLPPSADLPADFVAASADSARLVRDTPVEILALPGGPGDLAVVSRARAYVGDDPVQATLAVLSGVPAVLLGAERSREVEAVARLARSPFGSFSTRPPGEAGDVLQAVLGEAVAVR